MTEQSSQFSDLLLPKALLKPFREVEEEYLGSFISGQTSVHTADRREQGCVIEGLSERERLSERKKITKLLSKPCGCGNNCQKKFTVSEILDAHEDFRQMSWAEQHSFIIGKLQSFIHGTAQSKSARTSQSRQWQRFDYCITADRPVCRKFFLLYYGESIDRLKRRQKYLIETGTVPPAHGNTSKKPKHACSRDAIGAVLSFISNFAAIHGLPDPGRDLRAGKGKLTINKGHNQQTASAKAGISERSGRRIEKGKIPRDDKAIRHWRTHKDPFKKVWKNEVVPMLEQKFKLQPLTLFEHFAIKST